MAERCIKGDYIGFTFGGVHSSELGLMRVSNGSRYEQDLLPPLQDKTAQVNGRDGAVYFGSQYNTKPIKVPVAFDNMTEESFRELKRLLQDKKPKYLWFDETPYKQWLVKSANAQNFKWVCFDESHNGKEKRIYKGEGTLEFSCFSPYAESRVTFLDDEINDVIYRANGKLNFGKTPFLEILTFKNGESDRQLFSSSLVGDGVSGNKEFVIKEADNLIIKEKDEDKYENCLKEYVEIMSKKGYITLAERNLRENSDTENYSPAYNFFGFLTNKTIGSYYRIAIIEKDSLELIKNWIKDDSNFVDENGNMKSKETFQAILYGVSHNYEVDLYLYKNLIFNGSRYHSYNFCAENASNPYFFIYKDEKGILSLLEPVYDEEEEKLIDIRKSNLLLKILSLKGGIKQETNLIGAPNTIQNSYNYNEWVHTSKLRLKEYSNHIYNSYNNNKVYVYNAGDKPTDLFITYNSNPNVDFTLSIASSLKPDEEVGKIQIKQFQFKCVLGTNNEELYDNGFIIDSKLKLIKGTRDGQLSGIVYNKSKSFGDFFKIPICTDDEYYIITSSVNQSFSVEYKHHYI